MKLHKQFAHPSADKLVSLVRSANLNNKKLEREIRNVSEICDVCAKFKRCPPRPKVSMPLGNKFNEAISMDLKVWSQNLYFLVMVDNATKFCSASVIRDERPRTILNAIFLCWVSIFGPPKKF